MNTNNQLPTSLWVEFGPKIDKHRRTHEITGIWDFDVSGGSTKLNHTRCRYSIGEDPGKSKLVEILTEAFWRINKLSGYPRPSNWPFSCEKHKIEYETRETVVGQAAEVLRNYATELGCSIEAPDDPYELLQEAIGLGNLRTNTDPEYEHTEKETKLRMRIFDLLKHHEGR